MSTVIPHHTPESCHKVGPALVARQHSLERRGPHTGSLSISTNTFSAYLLPFWNENAFSRGLLSPLVDRAPSRCEVAERTGMWPRRWVNPRLIDREERRSPKTAAIRDQRFCVG